MQKFPDDANDIEQSVRRAVVRRVYVCEKLPGPLADARPRDVRALTYYAGFEKYLIVYFYILSRYCAQLYWEQAFGRNEYLHHIKEAMQEVVSHEVRYGPIVLRPSDAALASIQRS